MQKTIYVKDDDMKIFDEAEQMFDKESLSSIIAKALSKYIEIEKAKRQGFDEYTLEEYYQPGGQFSKPETTKVVKFIGKELVSETYYAGESSSKDDRGITHEVYMTKRKKYIWYEERWSRWQNEDNSSAIRVFDKLDDLLKELPKDLEIKVKEQLGMEYAEWID